MTGITRKAVALSLSAALILSGPIGAFAAPINGSAPKYVNQTGDSAGNSVVLVKKGRGRGGWKSHGRSHFRNRGRSFGHFKHRGHRRHNRGLFIAPFVAAPFLYGGYYGYDRYYDGDEAYCYRECRYDHSRSYCRRYWYRYC
jgi:hypothetical protein